MAHRLKWFLANKYVHLREFYGPSARSAAVPKALKGRVLKRLDRAVQVAKWRAVLFVLLYAGAVGTVITTILTTFAEATGSETLSDVGALVELLIVAAPILAAVALIGVIILNRILALLEADIQALGAEVVGLNLQSKTAKVLPSAQHLKWRDD